ncbi:hypothetical protein TNCV_2490941 [Trichonephila clavipes]|nr:hypothetical protein TNCV_2490941 [Trichonephila clavipes]
MVLKTNDRRTSCPCHDEFRGPRSDYVRQVASENNNNNMFTSLKLRCLPLGRKLGVKYTCGHWYPPIWCHINKRYQLPGNILGLQWQNSNPQPPLGIS